MKLFKALMGIACIFAVLVISIACVDQDIFPLRKFDKKFDKKEESKGFAVVELFTSEGCSSCPPADDLVAQVQKQNAGKQIYILAFHVDYWDHQGWKDAFSDASYSERQRQYAEWLNLRTIYTPQIVVNGKTEFVGSEQRSLVNAISSGLQEQPAVQLSLKGKVEQDKINVSYQVEGNLKRSELLLALVQKSGHSKVKAGENSGLSLSHVQIVRKIVNYSLDGKNGNSVKMALPDGFDSKSDWELIGFIQNTSNGTITGAARTDFSPTI